MLVCVFQAGGAYYAIDTTDVLEVNRYEAPTRIHGAAPEVLGLMNLRGRILTLLDAGLLMGSEAVCPGPEARLFVLESAGEYFAVLVERVVGVFEVDLPAADGVLRVGDDLACLVGREELLAGTVRLQLGVQTGN